MSTANPAAVVSAVRDFPLTMFSPKEGQTNFGVFEGQNVDVWMRIRASHAVSYNKQTDVWDSQWGQVIAFDAIARKLANLLNNDPKGRLNVRIYAKQEVTANVQDNQIYLNTAWLVWGFEHEGVFYTTQEGTIVQSDPRVVRGERVGQTSKDQADLLVNLKKADMLVVPEGHHVVEAHVRKNPERTPKMTVRG